MQTIAVKIETVSSLFSCGLRNGAVSNSDYTESNDWMTVESE
jgi:hypothetical protein